MQIEAETVQNQAVTPIAIPAVQGVDTEQPKVVYSQDAQEPDGNEQLTSPIWAKAIMRVG